MKNDFDHWLKSTASQGINDITNFDFDQEWQVIQGRLKKKKKSRRAIFFWLIPAIVTGSAVLYLMLGDDILMRQYSMTNLPSEKYLIDVCAEIPTSKNVNNVTILSSEIESREILNSNDNNIIVAENTKATDGQFNTQKVQLANHVSANASNSASIVSFLNDQNISNVIIDQGEQEVEIVNPLSILPIALLENEEKNLMLGSKTNIIRKKKDHFQLTAGIIGFVGLTDHRYISSDKEGEIWKSEIMQTEKSQENWGIQFRLEFPLAKRFSLNTGLQYHLNHILFTQKENYIITDTKNDIDRIEKNYYGQEVAIIKDVQGKRNISIDRKLHHLYHHVSLPIGISYHQTLWRKWVLVPEVGAMIRMKQVVSGKGIYDSVKDLDLIDLNDRVNSGFNMSFMGSLSLDYRLSANYSLRFGGYYSEQLNGDQINGHSVKLHMRNAGLQAGIFYNIK